MIDMVPKVLFYWMTFIFIYWCIIRKAISLTLVNHSKENLQRELLQELYKPEVLDELLKESDYVVSRRKEVVQMLGALNKADEWVPHFESLFLGCLTHRLSLLGSSRLCRGVVVCSAWDRNILNLISLVLPRVFFTSSYISFSSVLLTQIVYNIHFYHPLRTTRQNGEKQVKQVHKTEPPKISAYAIQVQNEQSVGISTLKNHSNWHWYL